MLLLLNASTKISGMKGKKNKDKAEAGWREVKLRGDL